MRCFYAMKKFEMKVSQLIVCCLLCVSSLLQGQDGYKINVKIKNYTNDTLILGYYLGDKQFVKDTTYSKNGSFTFSGKEALPPGIYMAVLLPQKNVFQFLVDKKNQNFSLEADAKDLSNGLIARKSPENTIFFSYISYITDQKNKVEPIKKALAAETDSAKINSLQTQVKSIDQSVAAYQAKLIADHPGTFAAKLIQASIDKGIPDYTNKPDSVKLKLFYHYKLHFFDNFDFSDVRLFHSPVYFQKIDHYINNLTAQHPDSIIQSLDYILDKTKVIDEAFQFYLSHYFNFYIQSKYVGMDAVYVHLIDKYYSTGQAPWVDSTNLQKMKDAADELRPTLIGKYAPDLTFYHQDGSPQKVSDIKSEYTVMFFWSPSCHHCEVAIPFVVNFYKKFKARGVEVIAICTGLLDEATDCWKDVKERDMTPFVNVNDPTLTSNFKVFYDVKATPKIFILDKNKKIISKSIAAEQLEEVMNKIIAADKRGELK